VVSLGRAQQYRKQRSEADRGEFLSFWIGARDAYKPGASVNGTANSGIPITPSCRAATVFPAAAPAATLSTRPRPQDRHNSVLRRF
jgi:hypothetical protein